MTLAEDQLELGKRVFHVGTTGWTADDLDDPEFEDFWEQGHYEIVEGVLTEMPAAHLDDTAPFMKFMSRLQVFLDDSGTGGTLSIETDVILRGGMRVPRVDGAYLASELLSEQQTLHSRSKKTRRQQRRRYGRVRVVPTLLIESISLGHEAHHRVTKRRWYAESGLPHYWIFDAYAETVETLVLDGGSYRTEQLARETDELRSSLFPGLVIPLARLWI